MFTVDTVVDNAVKTSKAVLIHVPNEDVRTSMEKLVEANATFAKTVYNTSFELAKNVADSAIAFFPKQPAATSKSK
jgi:hypothetical protein